MHFVEECKFWKCHPTVVQGLKFLVSNGVYTWKNAGSGFALIAINPGVFTNNDTTSS
jgi:hypothetical protein